MSRQDEFNTGTQRPTIYHAQMDAPGRDHLHAFGETHEEAVAALKKGFKAHLTHFDMSEADWRNQTGEKDPLEYYGHSVTPVQTGNAYRYGSEGKLKARKIQRGTHGHPPST